MQNVTLLNFKAFSDSRGSLVPIEFPKTLPFPIKRIYYIYNVDKDEKRGFHSHKDLHQILICLGGSVKIKVKDSKNEEIYILDKANDGLYIGPMIWREMYEFSENATLLVLASKEFSESDYIRNYSDYEKCAKKYFKEDKLNNYMKSNTIKLKLVEEIDAKFLLDTRMNENLNKYLSKVNNSLEEQINWIRNYKVREFNKKEFYFKILDKKNNEVGFVRLYNIDYKLKQLTFGSFILNDNKPKYAALEAIILMMEISFKYLNMQTVFLDVRKNNEHAKKFYNRFGFKKIMENDIDEFYELKSSEYNKLFLNKYNKYIMGE